MSKIDIEAPKKFPSEEAAKTWIRQYYSTWPPQGYGTSLNYHQESDGSWSVRGYMFDSCD